MAVRIVADAGGAHERYWERLTQTLGAAGLGIGRVTFEDWERNKAGLKPEHDAVIADSADAYRIGSEFAAVAVVNDCHMESALRLCQTAQLAAARNQRLLAGRKRTFVVAANDWLAIQFRAHTGVKADRIVFHPTDTDTYFPTERQRVRNTGVPRVLYLPNSETAQAVGAIGKHLGGGFKLVPTPEPTAEAMRDADMWLSLAPDGSDSLHAVDAMASGLIVVGADAGILWTLDGTEHVFTVDGGSAARVNLAANTVVFHPDFRHWPQSVAGLIERAWQLRTHFQAPNQHALQWLSLDTFRQKWIEALSAGMQRFGLKEPPAPPPKPAPAKAPQPAAKGPRIATPNPRQQAILRRAERGEGRG